MKYILILFVFSALYLPAQQKFVFNNYTLTFTGSILEVKDNDKLINEYKFNDPAGFSTDLDNDGLDDFLVIDHNTNSSDNYRLYLFNTIDSLYIADSINSGNIVPYFTLSEEIGEIIIVAGNPDFISFKEQENYFLPINCFKFESGEVMQINDELYDIYISENEAILEYIDEYFTSNIKNCTNSSRILSAIASAYANYLNAGEPTLAHQLIANYYFCDDSEQFAGKVNDLLYKWKDKENEDRLE